MNSFQSPVAGEPSLGTDHPQSGTHAGWLISGAAPGAATWGTVTFSVPAGTKAVIAYVELVTGASGNDDVRWRPYNNGDSYANSFHRKITRGTGASDAAGATVKLLVDSQGRVEMAYGVAGSSFSVGYPQLYGA